MALLTFFGCLFISLGPGVAIFLTIVTKKSYLPVVMIGSSFFWLFAVLLGSIFWYIVPPIQSTWGFIVAYSAILQEVLRFGYFKLYMAAERGFSKMAGSTAALTDGLMSAIASGLGWGVIYVLVMYVGLLFNATGPGDLYVDSCPRISFFLTSAFHAGCYLMLHVFFMVAAFDGYFRRSLVQPAVVALLHVGTSMVSLANRNASGCLVSLPLLFAFTAGTGAYTSVLVHRRKPAPLPSAVGRPPRAASGPRGHAPPPAPPVVDGAPSPSEGPSQAGRGSGSLEPPRPSQQSGGSGSPLIPGADRAWVDDGAGPSLSPPRPARPANPANPTFHI